MKYRSEWHVVRPVLGNLQHWACDRCSFMGGWSEAIAHVVSLQWIVR